MAEAKRAFAWLKAVCISEVQRRLPFAEVASVNGLSTRAIPGEKTPVKVEHSQKFLQHFNISGGGEIQNGLSVRGDRREARGCDMMA